MGLAELRHKRPCSTRPCRKTAPSLTISTRPVQESLPQPPPRSPMLLYGVMMPKKTQMICQPDRKLKATKGQEERANQIWHRIASRCHVTVDYTLRSQPLAVAFTKELCIGGRAWPNVNFAKKDWDYAFAIWMNSTLGLILFWWHANRQQPGRAIITISTSKTLPVLNFGHQEYKERMGKAKAIFDRFKHKSFCPAYRAELDKEVLKWLGFGKDIYDAVRGLARKWCAEPSVHGGKQRHKNNTLIS